MSNTVTNTDQVNNQPTPSAQSQLRAHFPATRRIDSFKQLATRPVYGPTIPSCVTPNHSYFARFIAKCGIKAVFFSPPLVTTTHSLYHPTRRCFGPGVCFLAKGTFRTRKSPGVQTSFGTPGVTLAYHGMAWYFPYTPLIPILTSMSPRVSCAYRIPLVRTVCPLGLGG